MMYLRCGFLGGLLLMGLTTAALAEPVTIGKTASLHSEVLDEERPLLVYLPREDPPASTRYPVLYLIGGRDRFHYVTGIVGALSGQGHIPEMIVVGITNTARTRDLTPPWTQPEGAPDWAETIIPQGGGADNFLRFLEEELVPHVDESYRTAPFRILVGHSFGGLFALHSFVHQPDLFGAILAISPSLQWDHGLLVKQARAMLAERPELRGHLYATIADEGGELLANFRRLEQLLRHRAPQGLSWQMKAFDGEDHGSIPIPSVHLGLKAFYPRWQAPEFVTAEGLAGVDRHYADLSAEYGYDIPVPESTLNVLGYVALGEEKIDTAIDLFEANVERYPGSANVYDSLGEAMEAAGRLAEAQKLYQRAIDIGEGNDDPNLGAYRGHLDSVTAKLREGA